MTRKLAALKAELEGTNPTPLERLLAERVAACWLHLHHLEYNYAAAENPKLKVAEGFQRCLSAAQKRYLAAIKTLDLVRRRAVPVLQVNIAREQVNVAAPALGASR